LPISSCMNQKFHVPFRMARSVFVATITAAVLSIVSTSIVRATDKKTSSDGKVVIDIDAMASRMKNDQPIYRQIRDDGLAAYAKTHPGVTIDDETKAFMGISAYLWVWGDIYGEDLWQKGTVYAGDLLPRAQADWQANIFLREATLENSHSASVEGENYVIFSVSNAIASDYPFELKMQACAAGLGDLAAYKSSQQVDPQAASFKAVPIFLKAWGEGYRQMLKGKFSHEQLFSAASCLFCALQSDENFLNCAIAEIDEDFNEVDPENPVKVAVDGDYFVNAAWCARGSDWANKVTENGWKIFGERLVKADEILEAGFAKYPGEGEMARTMIDVELGQGQGRDRMEMWFQRAIKTNPDDYDAYKGKEWYLQPRWFGSVDDIMSFGAECAKTNNWQAKLPVILCVGIAEASDQDPTLYARDDVWKAVEKVYRDYLAHYPNSISYRTAFAKHAYDGGHLNVAREQFNILRGDFDKSVLSNEEFMKINAGLNSK
jgi:hypothetical protein